MPKAEYIDGKVWRLVPPEPPPRYWLIGAPPQLVELQAKQDAGEPFTTDEFVYYHAERGKRDLYFFAKRLADCRRIQPDLHRPLAWAWTRPNGDVQDGVHYGRFRVAKLPRASYKTYLLTQAYAAWLLVNNPEARILVYSHSLPMAKKIYGRVRSLFEGRGYTGRLFLACYGKVVPPKREREKWSETMLTLVREGSYTDASLEAAGVEAGVTGGHFTHQLIDDLIKERIGRTEMEKVFERMDNLTPLMDSTALSERRMVATPWGFSDPLTHALRGHPDALVACRQWEEDGRTILDEKYVDRKEIESLRATNYFFYSCQYNCWPSDKGKRGFLRQWFRYFRREGNSLIRLDADGKEAGRQNLAACNVFILVDPDTGRTGVQRELNRPQSETDYCGIIVLAVAPDTTWYVLQAIRARWPTERFVNEVFTLVDYWKPRYVALEQAAAQYLYNHIFAMEFKRRGKSFALVPWPSGGKSKIEDRIGGLQLPYYNGQVYHLESDMSGGTALLEGELLEYPSAAFDDASDALSAGLSMAYAPGRDAPAAAFQPTSTADKIVAKLDEASGREYMAWLARRRGAEQSEFWRN